MSDGGKGKPAIDPRTGKLYVERKYSDLLTIFLLKKMLPDKFGDHVGGPSSGTTIRIDFSKSGY